MLGQALRDNNFEITEYVDPAGGSMRYLNGFPIATEVTIITSVTFNRMQFPETPDRAEVVMTLLGLERTTGRPIGFTGKMRYDETAAMIVSARRSMLRIPVDLR